MRQDVDLLFGRNLEGTGFLKYANTARRLLGDIPLSHGGSAKLDDGGDADWHTFAVGTLGVLVHNNRKASGDAATEEVPPSVQANQPPHQAPPPNQSAPKSPSPAVPEPPPKVQLPPTAKTLAPNSGLGSSTRLTADELATGQRLEAQLGKSLKESPHIGAEYVDELGRTYDALGKPVASKFWDQKKFLASIDDHLLKSTDFTVIDLTGFTPAQIAAVNSHLATLSPAQLARIIRIGF